MNHAIDSVAADAAADRLPPRGARLLIGACALAVLVGCSGMTVEFANTKQDHRRVSDPTDTRGTINIWTVN
jgi:hypothetical protein